MKIVLEGENAITLLPLEGMLTIESEHADLAYSPFHMMGSALATCTFAVLHSWAHHTGLDVGDLRLHVEWEFGEDPHRLTNIRTDIHWPSLPATRRVAAERAAELCAIHATLRHPVQLDTALKT